MNYFIRLLFPKVSKVKQDQGLELQVSRPYCDSFYIQKKVLNDVINLINTLIERGFTISYQF